MNEIYHETVKIKPPQEQLSDLVGYFSDMREHRQISHVLGVDFRDYFLALGKKYQTLFADQNFLEQNKEEIGLITDSLNGGKKQLADYNEKVDDVNLASPGEKRRFESPYFNHLRSIETNINEMILSKMIEIYNIKSEKKYILSKTGNNDTSLDRMPAETNSDKFYHSLQRLAEFLKQAMPEICQTSEANELLTEELAIAQKVLSQPGLYTHNTVRSIDQIGINNHRLKKELFHVFPDNVRLMDYFPVWLRSLPYFTDKKFTKTINISPNKKRFVC